MLIPSPDSCARSSPAPERHGTLFTGLSRRTGIGVLGAALALNSFTGLQAAASVPLQAANEERLLRQARKSVRAGKYAAAIELYQQVIEGDPGNVAARLGAALGYAKSLNYQACFDHARETLKLDPANARAHFGAINQNSGFEQGGILGGDFLKHFSVTIDFTRGELAFQQHSR